MTDVVIVAAFRTPIGIIFTKLNSYLNKKA